MESTGQKTLFDEFKRPRYQDWREAAEKLLKGAPFDKIMLTPTVEDITLQPIYRREDLDGTPAASTMPGMDGFTRGARVGGYAAEPWRIAQEIPYGNPPEFNRALLHDLAQGQDAVNLVFDRATMRGVDPDSAADGEVGVGGLSVASLSDWEKALDGVYPNAVPIYLQSGCSGLALHAVFRAWLREHHGVHRDEIQGGIGMDPIGYLVRSGRLPTSLEALFNEMATVARDNVENLPNFTAAGVSGLPYHCAGASATQELAAVLATGLEYVRALTERGLDIHQASRQIHFTLSLGPNFFMEIAKFRAARPLWAQMVRALGGDEAAQAIRLSARTGLHNKTRYDPYANLLRTTTEALAAIVAGVDSLCVGAFDEIIRTPDEFSRRIARNTQIVLREECELKAVIDPAGGSWFIENLTQQVARQAWTIFQQIEKEGGFISALQSGFVQQSIADVADRQRRLVGQRRLVLVGTNKYPNLDEKPLAENHPDFTAAGRHRAVASTNHRLSGDPDSDGMLLEQLADIQRAEPNQLVPKLIKAACDGATLGEINRTIRANAGEPVSVFPLPNQRLAELYEALRDAANHFREKNGHGPKIFLVNLGSLKQHQIRADFTRSFFATGGFEIVYSPGFEDAHSAANALAESRAKVAVICGTDEQYAGQVPALSKAIKARTPEVKLLLAGHPGSHESIYRAAGLDDFIFIKSDNYETNRQYLEYLGVL